MKTSRANTAKMSVSNLLLVGAVLFVTIFASSCVDPVEDDVIRVTVLNTPVAIDTSYDVEQQLNLPEGIYEEEVFSSVVVARRQLYSQVSDLTYDYYVSTQNPDTAKPLVLLSPGGAWKKYSQLDKLELLGKNLAKRGYAVALVKYSITSGTPGFDTYLNSVKDQQTAIRYFKSKSELLGIDPEKVFIGGWSTGAVISIVNGFASEYEIEEIETEMMRDGIVEEIALNGYYSEEYTEFDHSVKGVLVMMGFANAATFIDAEEPALMMINHEDALLSDRETRNIGEFTTENGVTQFGTDVMFARAIEVGYSDGENLEYIRMDDTRDGVFGGNYASLSSEHWDDIAAFFFRNL